MAYGNYDRDDYRRRYEYDRDRGELDQFFGGRDDDRARYEPDWYEHDVRDRGEPIAHRDRDNPWRDENAWGGRSRQDNIIRRAHEDTGYSRGRDDVWSRGRDESPYRSRDDDWRRGRDDYEPRGRARDEDAPRGREEDWRDRYHHDERYVLSRGRDGDRGYRERDYRNEPAYGPRERDVRDDYRRDWQRPAAREQRTGYERSYGARGDRRDVTTARASSRRR